MQKAGTRLSGRSDRGVRVSSRCVTVASRIMSPNRVLGLNGLAPYCGVTWVVA